MILNKFFIMTNEHENRMRSVKLHKGDTLDYGHSIRLVAYNSCICLISPNLIICTPEQYPPSFETACRNFQHLAKTIINDFSSDFKGILKPVEGSAFCIKLEVKQGDSVRLDDFLSEALELFEFHCNSYYKSFNGIAKTMDGDLNKFHEGDDYIFYDCESCQDTCEEYAFDDIYVPCSSCQDDWWRNFYADGETL